MNIDNLPPRASRDPEAWRIWASGMALLRAIHREIEPIKQRMRDAENYCVRGTPWECNDDCRYASPDKYQRIYGVGQPDGFDLAAHNNHVFQTAQILKSQQVRDTEEND